MFLQQENSCWQIQIPSKITSECGDVLRVPLQVAVLLGGKEPSRLLGGCGVPCRAVPIPGQQGCAGCQLC